MAGFRAVGGVSISSDFNFEYLEAGAVVWLEQVIQDFALLLRGIVKEQSRSATAAAEPAKAVKRAAAAGAVDCDDRGCDLHRGACALATVCN